MAALWLRKDLAPLGVVAGGGVALRRSVGSVLELCDASTHQLYAGRGARKAWVEQLAHCNTLARILRKTLGKQPFTRLRAPDTSAGVGYDIAALPEPKTAGPGDA